MHESMYACMLVNDEKKSVDLRLLYDILRGLKALCDSASGA